MIYAQLAMIPATTTETTETDTIPAISIFGMMRLWIT